MRILQNVVIRIRYKRERVLLLRRIRVKLDTRGKDGWSVNVTSFVVLWLRLGGAVRLLHHM
jgi:hypothetical protein